MTCHIMRWHKNTLSDGEVSHHDRAERIGKHEMNAMQRTQDGIAIESLQVGLAAWRGKTVQWERLLVRQTPATI